MIPRYKEPGVAPGQLAGRGIGRMMELFVDHYVVGGRPHSPRPDISSQHNVVGALATSPPTVSSISLVGRSQHPLAVDAFTMPLPLLEK